MLKDLGKPNLAVQQKKKGLDGWAHFEQLGRTFDPLSPGARPVATAPSAWDRPEPHSASRGESSLRASRVPTA